jgi:hypothetical protein
MNLLIIIVVSTSIRQAMPLFGHFKARFVNLSHCFTNHSPILGFYAHMLISDSAAYVNVDRNPGFMTIFVPQVGIARIIIETLPNG